MSSAPERSTRTNRFRPTPILRGAASAVALCCLAGCQLLQLPFQLLIGIVQLAVKLIPIVPLFLYQPVDTPAPGLDPIADGEVRLAALERLDDQLDAVRILGDDLVLQELQPASLDRPVAGHRLVGLVLVPAAHLHCAGTLEPALSQLREQGYRVEIGDVVDAGVLTGDDLLAQARFVRQSQRLDATVIAPSPLDQIETPPSESDLLADLPLELTALVR